MCGIAGVFLRGGAPALEALQEALCRLRHRGPDECNLIQNRNLAFGHTRLSIIDLVSGHQPMVSADQRYSIVFNGEIYNFQELRQQCEKEYSFQTQSDTEVILALYARYGGACVEHLRGMFAFAIYDAQERTVFLARDRLGVKPLLYAQTPRGFYFASEISALLALEPTLRGDLDWQALVDFFARQYILAPRTAFRDIRKLEPGSTLLVREGEIARGPGRYWFPERTPASKLTEKEAEEELRRLFIEATRLRLISEVPLGAFLSGGVDSSITVAVMAQLLGKKFKTYSIGFADPKLDESAHAERVAAHCGTEHETLRVEYGAELPELVQRLIEHFGEPFADESMVPTHSVAALAKRGLTVVLSGDGADEIWGGYKRHYHVALMGRIKRSGMRSAWLAGRRLTTRLENLLGKDKTFPVSKLDKLLLQPRGSAELLSCKLDAPERARLFIAPDLVQANQNYRFETALADNADWDDLTRFLLFDLQTFLAGDVLPKVDIATMMNSLEARSPFLDHKLIEFAFSLPISLKRPNLRDGKYLLKKTFAPLLPPGHFNRPKMGFTPPLAAWLRTHLKDWCGDLLAGKACKQWLNHGHLQSLFAEHQAGKDRAKRLWLAAVFCQWAQSVSP